jgi:predicted DNA-binding antitoxin AbrB/MazE fold protein
VVDSTSDYPDQRALEWRLEFMTKQIEAIYERGIIRPIKPLELPEGTRLDVIVITHEKRRPNGNVAQILAKIAALPLERASHSFSGREHDSVLYPKKPVT